MEASLGAGGLGDPAVEQVQQFRHLLWGNCLPHGNAVEGDAQVGDPCGWGWGFVSSLHQAQVREELAHILEGNVGLVVLLNTFSLVYYLQALSYSSTEQTFVTAEVGSMNW